MMRSLFRLQHVICRCKRRCKPTLRSLNPTQYGSCYSLTCSDVLKMDTLLKSVHSICTSWAFNDL